jgi:hypothetical protein
MAVPDRAQAKGSRGAGQMEMRYREAAKEATAIATADQAFHMFSSNTCRQAG